MLRLSNTNLVCLEISQFLFFFLPSVLFSICCFALSRERSSQSWTSRCPSTNFWTAEGFFDGCFRHGDSPQHEGSYDSRNTAKWRQNRYPRAAAGRFFAVSRILKVLQAPQYSMNSQGPRNSQISRNSQCPRIASVLGIASVPGMASVLGIASVPGASGVPGIASVPALTRKYALRQQCSRKEAGNACRTRLQLSLLRSLSRQLERAFPDPLEREEEEHSHDDLFWF